SARGSVPRPAPGQRSTVSLVRKQHRLVRGAGLLENAQRPVEEDGRAEFAQLQGVPAVLDALAQQLPNAVAQPRLKRVAVEELPGTLLRLTDLLLGDAPARGREGAGLLA